MAWPSPLTGRGLNGPGFVPEGFGGPDLGLKPDGFEYPPALA